MDSRTIAIANTKTQKRYNIESSATTLGELQDQMAEMGIDFAGMSFTEGISKTQLLTRDSLLPTNVMYKGQPTNNLVMLLTNTTKNISSGALSRKEVYAIIKERGLAEDIKEAFDENYTRIPTADLEAFIMDTDDEDDDIIDDIEDNENEKHFVLPHAKTVNWVYDGVKGMAQEHLLYVEDIEALAELFTELGARLKEVEVFSDKDIDAIIANL